MKLGSLCSGAGGLDMAVESVFGAETVWHCELDPAASKVLAHRWPGVPNHGDLTTTDWSCVEPVDIICAGWPCQPWSMAGKRKGIEDERALWPHIAGAIRLLRPRSVALENVSAVLTAGEFQRVADSVAEAGYDIAWTCLRASDVGAPHQRERLFVLATDSDVSHSGTHASRSSRENGYSVARLRELRRDGNSGLPHESASHSPRDGRHQERPEPAGLVGGSDASVGGAGPVELLPTPTSRDGKGANQRGDDTCLTEALLPTPNAADSHRGPDLARANRDGSGGDDLHTFIYKTGRDNQWGKYEPAIRRWETLTRPAPAPTEPNKNGNPRLSAAFSEWLMGWPAGWVTNPAIGISHDDQLRIIGNGVVPQQACAALSWLLSLEMVA